MSKPKKAVNSPTGQSASPQRLNPIYPKPTVPVALGEFLSPKQVTASVLEVVVTYPSIKPGDVIALKFNGDDTFVPVEAGNQTSVSFWVSVPHIIKALGTTVDIQYTLSGESAGQKSDILQLTVLPFMEGDLKMAKITEASPPTPGVLDLATFTGDAEVKVAPWPMIEAGQTVWLDLEYEGQSGAIPIIAGEKVTTDEVGTGMTRSIIRTDLEKAPHDKLIKLPLKVNFSDAAIIPFPALELVVLQKGGGEDIENFDGESLGLISGGFLNTPLIKFEFRATEMRPEIVGVPGAKKLQFIAFNNVATVAEFIKKTYSTVTFDFYTAEDSVIESYGSDPQDNRTQFFEALSTTTVEILTENIDRIEFRGPLLSTMMTIDNIIMK